jgi:hypothetical protein
VGLWITPGSDGPHDGCLQKPPGPEGAFDAELTLVTPTHLSSPVEATDLPRFRSHDQVPGKEAQRRDSIRTHRLPCDSTGCIDDDHLAAI